ncbi:MAG: protein translocase subunit SecD [Clostridium sp.]|nr:protein translocase subunit SecD [Clostridium sp.]
MKKILKPIVITFLILVGCILLIKPTLKSIHYGIDLQGGFEILYNIEPLKKGDTVTEDDLDKTYKAIVNRIDTLGVSEPVISFEGNDLIRIQLPGLKNEEEARQRIGTTAVLSMRDTEDNLLLSSDVFGRGGATLEQNSKTFQYQVKLDIKDTEKFYEITKKISKKPNGENLIVIWLDFVEGLDSYENEKTTCGKDANMKCISSAYVNEALNSNSVVIEGSFTKEEAQNLVDLINSGSLPTKLTEEATPKSVSPSFGSDTIKKTGIAGIITFALIMVILVVKYRLSGIVASVCLFVYALLVFVVFNLVGGVLTLTGIAALVLGIGMAVDSIIISNSRVHDELLKGKKLREAFKDGNKSSLGAIIDANITTFIAGVVLYIFGESSVKGFATMLIITIFVTVLCTVILYRVLLELFVNSKAFNSKEKLLFGISKKPKQKDYVKFGKVPTIVSLVIIIVGIIFACVRGFNFGVDFTGGTNINISSSNDIDFNKVTELVRKYDVRDYDYYMGTKKEGFIKLNDILDDETSIKVKKEFEKLGYTTSSSEISTLVTKNLTSNAVKSLIYSLIAIIIYVAIRFNMNFAVTGILMLIHDVLVILSIFAIFYIPVDFIIVASLLTIIGYSINDTIVVFDRIRENRKKLYNNRKELTDEEINNLVNVSSSNTFNRNIWTSITTIIAVVTLICVGLNDIYTFNISVLIGLIAGTISSLLIGPRLWIRFEKRTMHKKDDDDEEEEELKIKGINI